MQKRSTELEIMDLGPQHYTIEEYNECLENLNSISKYLSNNKKIINNLKKTNYKIESILDVGCGGGQFSMDLARNFKNAKIVGIDINQNAIDYATNQKQDLTNLEFQIRYDEQLNEPEKSFDVLVTSLVTHHLNDAQIIDFLLSAKKIARKQIIINDLHRHWLAYLGCKIIFPIFFSNRLTKNDALVSIKKSFTKQDWAKYLQAAGFEKNQYVINWQWPFRLVVRININE